MEVYFVTDGERTKIGISRNVEQRIMQLQVMNPHQLRLTHRAPGHWATERKIQGLLADRVVHGEWYRGVIESAEAIELLARAADLQITTGPYTKTTPTKSEVRRELQDAIRNGSELALEILRQYQLPGGRVETRLLDRLDELELSEPIRAKLCKSTR